MNAQISAELLKIRTTRALYVATAIVVAFAALIPTMACTDPVKFGVAPLTAASLADLMRAPAQVAGGAALLLGILASATEYTHRSILITRLVQPNPARVLVTKIIAMAAVGAALGAASDATAAGVGAIGLAANGITPEPLSHGIPGITATVILLVAGYAVLGTAIGTLLRNTTAAVGITLIWALAIENILPVITGNPRLADWMPGNAAQQILTPQSTGPAPPAAGALLLATTATMIALALTADARRDP
jgi:ABC-2 type transport system permease protein